MLVRGGIDHGIPAVTHGGSARGLVLIVGALCGVVVVHGHQPLVFPEPAPGDSVRKCCWTYAVGCSGTSSGSTSPFTSATPPAEW